eukprot:9140934-Pyramimonas_sp.AAC.1
MSSAASYCHVTWEDGCLSLAELLRLGISKHLGCIGNHRSNGLQRMTAFSSFVVSLLSHFIETVLGQESPCVLDVALRPPLKTNIPRVQHWW